MLWGLAFVATRIGLDELSPPQLTAARFVIAAAPVLWLPRPPAPWSALVPVGLTLFAGQFLFQFFGIAAGMPPGLASIVVQSQALFTIVLAAAFLKERPTGRQLAGLLVGLAGLATIGSTAGGDISVTALVLTIVSPISFAGLLVGLAGLGAIGSTAGGDLSVTALVLTLISPISFAVGNLLLKRLPVASPIALAAWLSLVPPIPALAVAAALDGPQAMTSVASLSWRGIAAAVYLGAVATTLSYAIWGDLLRRYPTALVTPFALLVPFVAAVSSAVVFGERFGGLRLVGMTLVLAALAVIVLPSRGEVA